MPPAAPPPPRERASARGTAALLAGAALLYGLAAAESPPLVGLYHDDGIYVGSALSLAAGRGYRVDHLPGRPLQAKYPPLHPLLLVPAAAWSDGDPAHPGAFRIPPLLATLAALALLPGLLRRWGLAPGAAVAASAATAAAPLVFQHGLQPLSEAPYLLLTIALFRLLPAAEESAGRGRWAAAAACAAAAVWTRSIGAALLPALVVAAWPRRRAPRAWAPAVALALAFGGWWLVAAGMRRAELARGLDPLYAYYVEYGASLVPSRAALPTVLAENLRGVLLGAGDALLGGRVLDAPHWRGPAALLGAAALLGWLRLARHARAETAYLATTLAVLLPFPFDAARYLVPLTPFVAAGAFAAGGALLGRLRAPPAAAGLAAAALVAAGLAVDLVRFPRPDRLPLLNRLVSVREFADGAAWLRANAAPDDVVVSDHDPWVHLATGLSAIPPGVHDHFWAYGDAAAEIDWSALWRESHAAARRHGARWIALSEHWHPVFRALWLRAVRSQPERFPLRFESGGFAVYELREPSPAARDDAEALRRGNTLP